MECYLCGHDKTYKHGHTSKGTLRRYCPNCRKTFPETFDTLYYRRQIESEKIVMILQAHSEGSSFRGISRMTNIAHNTVLSIVRAASIKGQMVHNHRVSHIETKKLLWMNFGPLCKSGAGAKR